MRIKMTDFSITCSCGQVTVEVVNLVATRTNRAICGCQGCRSYAYFLGREKEMLDIYGGTDLFQTSPKNFVIRKGRDALACVQQTPKGCLRWYASCCKTPLGNTPRTPAIPFVGISLSSVDQKEDLQLIERTIGPPRVRVNSPVPAPDTGFLKLPPMLLRFSWMLMKWKFAGEGRDSPFFDRVTGKPVVSPQRLTADEYENLIPS
jgi:hypothetical protein